MALQLLFYNPYDSPYDIDCSKIPQYNRQSVLQPLYPVEASSKFFRREAISPAALSASRLPIFDGKYRIHSVKNIPLQGNRLLPNHLKSMLPSDLNRRFPGLRQALAHKYYLG